MIQKQSMVILVSYKENYYTAIKKATKPMGFDLSATHLLLLLYNVKVKSTPNFVGTAQPQPQLAQVYNHLLFSINQRQCQNLKMDRLKLKLLLLVL